MNFYTVHTNRKNWNYTVLALVLLLPLNTGAAFHSGLDTALGLINFFFAVFWVCALAFQLSHMPRKPTPTPVGAKGTVNTAFYQPTEPTGGAYFVGDTWFDTANGYSLYLYTAPGVWTKISDGHRS